MQTGKTNLGPEGCAEVDHALSFAQDRMWFLDRLEGGRSTAYVATPMWRVHGPLDRERLEFALSRLVARHQSLRMRFVERDGTPRVLVADRLDARIDWRDAATAAEVETEAAAEAGEPFDLTTGPLFRAVVWRLDDTEHVLLAADASHRLRRLVDGRLRPRPRRAYDGDTLPELSLPYADLRRLAAA